jgi:hypothetical protein
MSQPHDTIIPERRFPWGKTILITLALLLIGLIAIYWLMGRGAESRLLALAETYRKNGEPIYPQDFIQPAIAPADNAVLDLRAAADAIRLTEEQDRLIDYFPQPAFPLTDAEMRTLRQVMDANAEAIRLAHAATAKSGINWELDFNRPVVMLLLPDLQRQRRLAVLLKVVALQAHQSGDDAAALERIKDMAFIARAVNQQPLLVSHLVATSLRAMTSQCALELAPDLRLAGLPTTQPSAKPADRQHVRALIAQLLDEEIPRTGLVNGLRGERMGQLDMTRLLAAGQLNLNQLSGGPPAANFPGQLFKPFILEDGQLMLRFTTQTILAAAEPDLPAAKNKMPDWKQIPRSPLHLTAQMLLPALDRSITVHFRSAADRRAAATALALRLYAADHAGRLPGTLADLVPAYLPALPLDPFASNKPLNYLPDAANPLLYSVGENGLDEQGNASPIHPRNDPSRWECYDAVYHLTRQPRQPPEEQLPADPTPPPTTAPAAPQAQ